MISRRLRLFHRHQVGFTVLEVIVALVITGVIGLGATMTVAQVLNQTARNNDYTTASRQTLNAIHWISQDTQMAQTVVPGGAAGFPLTLTWVEWDNTTHSVVYSLAGNQLRRNYSVDGGTPRQNLIAEYINPDTALTSATSDNGVLTLTITASVGPGTNTVDVTKVREITSRPNL